MRIILLSIFVLSVFKLNAKTNISLDTIVPGRMLSFRDSLMTEVESSHKRYLIHKLKAGQTLYSLSKYYAISVGDLKYYNPALENTSDVKVGFPIKIPVSLPVIRRKENEMTAVKWKVVPVFYRVRPGETIYRIAKSYFGMPIEVLAERNGLVDNALEVGQLLHIGWFDVKGVNPNMRQHSGLSAELHAVNVKLGKKYRSLGTVKSERTERGIAVWSKKDNRNSNLYALHRTAPVGTIIKVYNPMTKRTLYVKVMGRLSDNYENAVLIYLSPVAASALGALDDKFMVNLSYH